MPDCWWCYLVSVQLGMLTFLHLLSLGASGRIFVHKIDEAGTFHVTLFIAKVERGGKHYDVGYSMLIVLLWECLPYIFENWRDLLALFEYFHTYIYEDVKCSVKMIYPLLWPALLTLDFLPKKFNNSNYFIMNRIMSTIFSSQVRYQRTLDYKIHFSSCWSDWT